MAKVEFLQIPVTIHLYYKWHGSFFVFLWYFLTGQARTDRLIQKALREYDSEWTEEFDI